MKKKLALLLAALLITGCGNNSNQNKQNYSNSNTTNQTNNNDNNNSTNTGTGDNTNTNKGTGTGTEDNSQGNNNNQGNGEGTNTGTGEGSNTGSGEGTNTGGDNTQGKKTYEDVSIKDSYVNPGFPNDYKYKEDLMAEGKYGETFALNDTLKLGFNSIAKHYYTGEFTNKLPDPKTTVSNFDDLVYVFEYCGFYGIKRFNVKFDSGYSFVAASKEFNKAFWASRMLSQTAGFEYANVAYSSYDLTFIYNEFACTAISKAVFSTSAVNPYKITSTEGKFIEDIPYTPTKGDLDVQNSDQLIYAIENGYNPKMVKDSRVDLIYRKACYLLTHTITDNMNDIQKIYVVNDTIFNIADYDSPADDIACGILTDSQLEAKFPAALASTFVSFFADGPLLYGGGTCAGFAKAQALMFALLNIKHQRVTGGNVVLEDTIYSKNAEEGYWYHEYNYYIDSNDKYYICDITYSCGGNIASINEQSYRFPIRPICAAFTREYWGQCYDPKGIFNDLVKVYKNSSLGTENLEYYKQVMVSGNTSMYVTDYASIKAAVAAGKEAINAYKAKNNITTPQMYLLSFFTDVNTAGAAMDFMNGSSQVYDEECDVIAWYWGHYSYGLHYFLYM